MILWVFSVAPKCYNKINWTKLSTIVVVRLKLNIHTIPCSVKTTSRYIGNTKVFWNSSGNNTNIFGKIYFHEYYNGQKPFKTFCSSTQETFWYLLIRKGSITLWHKIKGFDDQHETIYLP